MLGDVSEPELPGFDWGGIGRIGGVATKQIRDRRAAKDTAGQAGGESGEEGATGQERHVEPTGRERTELEFARAPTRGIEAREDGCCKAFESQIHEREYVATTSDDSVEGRKEVRSARCGKRVVGAGKLNECLRKMGD